MQAETKSLGKPRPGMGALFLLGAIVTASAHPASAVPVFARKYHTTCQTCHVIFPKLNPHGEAFRLNGYRMPVEKEVHTEEEPLSLGAEGYKKVWPKNVWPGDMPGNVPLALNIKMADLVTSHDDSGARVVKNDFQFPQEVNLFSAGTLGEHFSFLSEVTYEEAADGGAEFSIERAQLHLNSPFGPEHAFNFKIGKFAPDVADGFQEMWLMTNNGIDTLFAYDPIGIRGGVGLEEGTGIGLPSSVKGLEMYGVAAHRLFYTLGIVNGLGPSPNGATDGNNAKDLFARVDYKFGGMGLDGDMGNMGKKKEMSDGVMSTGKKETSHGDMGNMNTKETSGGDMGTGKKEMSEGDWRERSFRVGAFGYSGDGTHVPFDITDDAGNPFQMEDRRFERAGLYASWCFGDLNLFGVAMKGHDQLRLLDADTGENLGQSTRSYDAWFLQADYVIRPPFQVSLRYEDLKPADPEADDTTTLNANISFLVRANVKAMLEYNRDLQNTNNYNLAAVLRFAY